MGEKREFRAATPERQANALLKPTKKAASTETAREAGKPETEAERASAA
ncbi:MAG: hypothetical protein OXI22_17300 [Defluviicoccus sp.]|nr:hypothetical protein [Defluviicoccus sp.]MDE0385643.1 hypothetical protein [Defluviicoccus sp.]